LPYTIEHRLPTAKQWMKLRESVGWATFTDDAAEKSLWASLFCVCAFEDGELIGMARVLGDGAISFYVGNVMVKPERQNEGIGRDIMNDIMAYVEKHAAKGAIASLLSISGKEEFYTQFGFEKRPDEKQGCGMSKRY
jgi:predicted N-acetyltransferase YhbS